MPFLLLFAVLVWLFPLLGYAQVRETIIEDKFMTNKNDWPEDIQKDYFSASVDYGVYHLAHMRAKGSKCFDIKTNLYPGRNFFIEVEGKIVFGDQTNGFGIVWGKGSEGFFSFAITADGRFYVRKAKSGTNGEYLITPRVSSKIKKNGQSNVLRVQLDGNEYVFFINGQFVAHCMSKPFFGDNTGIILYGKQQVDITRFGVYGTPKFAITQNYTANLKVSGYAIDDGIDTDGTHMGNGNSKVERGETIRINVMLKNVGKGNAENLLAVVQTEDAGTTIVDVQKYIGLGSAATGESVQLSCKFAVGSTFDKESVKLKVDILDNERQLAQTVGVTVPLNVSIPRIVENSDDGKLSINLTFNNSVGHDINSFYPVTTRGLIDAVVVVIGVEDYVNLPKAKHALNDARIFYNYMTKVLDIKRSNAILLTNQNATASAIKNIFHSGGRLENISYTKVNNIIVYFSGLGVSDDDDSEPYILPYNADINNLKQTAVSVSEILKYVRSLQPLSAMFFFETSFAGVDRAGNAFTGSGGTMWSIPSLPSVTESNISMMYASAGEQPAPVTDDSNHGLFTHFLLKTLQEYANNSNALNMRDLFAAISQGMITTCAKQNLRIVPKINCINKEKIFLLK